MRVSSGAAQVHVDVQGAGTDVLLLHAGVTDRRSWRPLIDALGPTYRCISPDRRGFGETTYVTDDGWSMVDDDVAVLEACGVERAIVVGASMGGQAAIDLALEHPDRVAGLVLIGSALAGGPAWQVTPDVEALEAQETAASEAGDLDAVNRITAHAWLDGLGHEGRVTGETRALFFDMNGRALQLQAEHDPGEQAELRQVDDLETIDVPTLVLIGEFDFPHLVQTSELLDARIPGARLVRLPGRAHLPHLEADPTCLEAVHAFTIRTATPR